MISGVTEAEEIGATRGLISATVMYVKVLKIPFRTSVVDFRIIDKKNQNLNLKQNAFMVE
jgi:hypothetical protein